MPKMTLIFDKTFTTRLNFAVIAEHIFVLLMVGTQIFLCLRLVSLYEINHALVWPSRIDLHPSWFTTEEAPNIAFSLIGLFCFEALVAECVTTSQRLGNICCALLFKTYQTLRINTIQIFFIRTVVL
jgi:hypothetical protein